MQAEANPLVCAAHDSVCVLGTFVAYQDVLVSLA